MNQVIQNLLKNAVGRCFHSLNIEIFKKNTFSNALDHYFIIVKDKEVIAHYQHLFVMENMEGFKFLPLAGVMVLFKIKIH